MDEFLAWSRYAFRTLCGLDPGGPPPATSESTRERLAAWARRHRLTGLLAAGLPDAGAARSAAFGQAQHAARFAHEAARIHALLAPRLPTLALVKGPALAAQAWPQPGLRSYDDLDFLCARRDYPRLLDGMREAGYAPAAGNPRRMAHLWHYGWGVAFRHPDGYLVEVNHRFFPPHYPWPDDLGADAPDGFARLELDAAEVRAPTPALHLLLCCEHAIWHGWARLAWLADIAGLLARHPTAYPQALALAWTCPFARQALAAGGAVAEELFGPGLCPQARTLAGVVPHACQRLEERARGMGRRELRKFHARFMTRGETAVYRLRRTFTPGDGDFRWIPLPRAARGLYWLLRPLRALAGPRDGA